MRKWAILEQKLKEVDDHNKPTGRDRRTWKFHNEMTACMGSSPMINPAVTSDTSSIVLTPSTASGSSSSSSFHGGDPTDFEGSDVESSDESAGPTAKDRKVRKAKLPSRKRKSKSSAAEMLRFLENYTERKEKLDAEKLNLLRSMKEEKKEFFAQFLEVMKGKTS